MRLESRQKLDAPEHALRNLRRQFPDGRDHAFQPEPHLRHLAAHLEMHVAGPGALSLLHQSGQAFRRGGSGSSRRGLRGWFGGCHYLISTSAGANRHPRKVFIDQAFNRKDD